MKRIWKPTPEEVLKGDLLGDQQDLITATNSLVTVRTGADVTDTNIIEMLARLRERFATSPDVIADALISQASVLGTDHGLDGDEPQQIFELV